MPPTLIKKSLEYHRKKPFGKLEIRPTKPINTKEKLILAYTPGVSYPCIEINKDKNKVWEYTIKSNTIAIITDGSRILGLGNIGPEAGLPVMEGKSLLYKIYGDVDAFPICIATQKKEEIINITSKLSPCFGCIHLEDIESPKCFEIEKKLSQKLNIPVFHDDQHGTAVAVLAALINSLKLAKKNIKTIKIIVNGAGAAGNAIAKLLVFYGAKNLIVLDSKGAIYLGRKNLGFAKKELAKTTNSKKEKGKLQDLIKNSDVFIGVSVPKILTSNMIKFMNKKPIIFALANPVPEIDPYIAKKAGAFIVGTGSSEYPNQINNAIAFPGIMRGLLDCRAKKITKHALVEAAKALAKSVERKLNREYIVPKIEDIKTTPKVASAVVLSCMKNKNAKIKITNIKTYENNTYHRIKSLKKRLCLQ